MRFWIRLATTGHVGVIAIPTLDARRLALAINSVHPVERRARTARGRRWAASQIFPARRFTARATLAIESGARRCG